MDKPRPPAIPRDCLLMGWSAGLFAVSAALSTGPWELWVLLFNPDRYSQASSLQDRLAQGGWAGLHETQKLMVGWMWGTAIVGAACFIFTTTVSAVMVLSRDRFNRAVGIIGLLLCTLLLAYAAAHRSDPIHRTYGSMKGALPRLAAGGNGAETRQTPTVAEFPLGNMSAATRAGDTRWFPSTSRLGWPAPTHCLCCWPKAARRRSGRERRREPFVGYLKQSVVDTGHVALVARCQVWGLPGFGQFGFRFSITGTHRSGKLTQLTCS